MKARKKESVVQIVIIIAIVYSLFAAVIMSKVDTWKKEHKHVSTGHPHHEVHNHKDTRTIKEQIIAKFGRTKQ